LDLLFCIVRDRKKGLYSSLSLARKGFRFGGTPKGQFRRRRRRRRKW